MRMNWQAIRGHAMVFGAIVIGIVGMGTVFSGVTDGNVGELSRGVPLLLPGIWWAGRELGRSMTISRNRPRGQGRRPVGG